jgi:hypothetical protein
VAAATLVALGLGVALAPRSVPALTLPGSPAAMRAMRGVSTPVKARHMAMPGAMPHKCATVRNTPGMGMHRDGGR